MIRSLIVAILCVFTLSGIAYADSDLYRHNDSTVELIWGEGDGVEIRYVNPRSGLPVQRGTKLFEGAITADGTIYGIAYVFSSKCGPIGYEVNGNSEGDNFVLRGAAPVRNSKCRVTHYDENENATLYFRAVN